MDVTTDRLTLVPIGPEHVAELVELHADPNVAYWNAGAWSEADARRFAVDMQDRWTRDLVGKWIAHRRFDGVLVGRGGLSLSVVDDQLRLELGWAVRDQMRGQGFATEIGAAGLAFGFDVLGADEVVAYTEAHNYASRAVMERLDMTFVKTIEAPGLVEGSDDVRDDAPFALYRITRPSDDAGGQRRIRSLGISERTVRNSVSGILAKLRLVDRSALIDRARAAGVGVATRTSCVGR